MARAWAVASLVWPFLLVKLVTSVANSMARSTQPVILKQLGADEAMLGSIMSAQFIFGGAANAVLLLSFGATLRRGSTPMIERFARLQEPDLSLPKQAWCRTWTKIWCAFFIANGAIAAGLARYADVEAWAFYNGLLAYALIGSLLALEWTLRRARFRDAPRRDGA